MDDANPRPWWRGDRGVALLLCAVAVVVHLPDLTCGFLADDFIHVVGVTSGGEADLGKALGYFIRPLPGVEAPLPEHIDPRFWRPMLFLSLGVDYALFGLQAAGFQAVSVAVHAGTVLALFGLLRSRDRSVAIAAAALFAAWPGSHEAVPWISARCGPMALGFLLGALWSVDARRPALAALFTMAALTSKETALIIGPLALVFALCRPTGRLAAARATAPVWLAFAVYLGLRYRMLGHIGGGYAVHDTSIWSPSLWPGRVETLRTLLAPLKTHHSGEGLQTAVSLGVVGFLLPGLVLAARDPARRWIGAGGLLWLGGSLVPMHNLTVFRHVHPDARFLYEPAAPLCLLLAVAGASLLRSRRLALGALVVAVVASGFLYRANVEDRRVATAYSRALRAAAIDAVRQTPEHKQAFIDLPRHRNGVQLANNTFPWALVPPFSPGPKPGPVEVHFGDQINPRRLEALEQAVRRGEPQAVWVWDDRGTLRRIRPR